MRALDIWCLSYSKHVMGIQTTYSFVENSDFGESLHMEAKILVLKLKIIFYMMSLVEMEKCCPWLSVVLKMS